MKSIVELRNVSSRLLSIVLLAALFPAVAMAKDAMPRADFREPSSVTLMAAPAADDSATTENHCKDPGDVCYDLGIRYTVGRIRNPSYAETHPKGFDVVKLRSYTGNVVNDAGTSVNQIPFVAPQVELKPGNTFRLTLHNDLAKAEDMGIPWLQAPCESHAPDHNVPHCANYNLTNMHTHGLWVSPMGNSDNVLLTINPGVSFTYEYNVPNDHPAGTFWYHSHRHGSTAVQVSSGMAGAIIIRAEREPVLENQRWTRPGDIDRILPRTRPADDLASPVFPERVLLFQQIAYACRDPNGAIKRVSGTTGPWDCDPVPPKDMSLIDRRIDRLGNINPAQVGTVEPGPVTTFDQLGPAEWGASLRHIAINGEVRKELEATQTGAVERWRLIGGGVRETIRLQIRKAQSSKSVKAYSAAALSTRKLAAAAQLNAVCTGPLLEVVGMATDGLTRPTLHPQTDTWIQPGYREDILVTFPSEGTYCVLNGNIPPADAVNANPSEPTLLGLVDVKGPTVSGGSLDRVKKALVASASRAAAFTNDAVRTKVIDDLNTRGSLNAFVWHRPIADEETEKSGTQTVGFFFKPQARRFEIGGLAPANDPNASDGVKTADRKPIAETISLVPSGPSIDGKQKPYDASTFRTLPLGSAQEWMLGTFGEDNNSNPTQGVPHPFHIHVNPFEIFQVLKFAPADGSVDPTSPDSWIDVSEVGSGSQYAGLKGAWKDTILVSPSHLVRVRSRYERYIGDFVLHCHILDHEDQGMMENVRVALPDGRGGMQSDQGHSHQ